MEITATSLRSPSAHGAPGDGWPDDLLDLGSGEQRVSHQGRHLPCLPPRTFGSHPRSDERDRAAWWGVTSTEPT